MTRTANQSIQMKRPTKLTPPAHRLLLEVALEPHVRWFASFETVHGFALLERLGLARRAGDRIELTPAGAERAAELNRAPK